MVGVKENFSPKLNAFQILFKFQKEMKQSEELFTEEFEETFSIFHFIQYNKSWSMITEQVWFFNV